jgi:hypothetical protein
VSQQTTFLFLLLCLGLVACELPPAHADWDTDQQYIDKAKAQVTKLKLAIKKYASYEKTLRTYEAELPSVRGGFADPKQKVVKLAEETTRSVHSGLRIRMQRASGNPKGTKSKANNLADKQNATIWRWQVELEGPSFAFGWALRRLHKLGLEAEATASTPMVLVGATEGQPPKLTFTGRHIRLAPDPEAKKNEKLEIGVALKRRADPQAIKIRKLLKEKHGLQKRLTQLRSVEHRVRRLQRYITYLRKRPPAEVHPANAIIPIAQFDLIRIQRIEHRGKSIHLWAKAISASARDTALNWIRQRSKNGPPIRALRVPLLYREADLALIRAPKKKSWGKRGELRLFQARPMDLALVSKQRAAVVVAADEDPISGRIVKTSMGQALAGAAKRFSLSISLDKKNSTFLVSRASTRKVKTKRSRKKRKKVKKGIDIFASDIAVSDALTLLRGRTTQQMRVPVTLNDATDRVTLIGNAPFKLWLNLLSNGLGLRPKIQRRGLKLVPLRGRTPMRQVYPSLSVARLGKRLAANAPLSGLQIRLLWLAGKRSSAVISDLDGSPRRITIGARIGIGQWKVIAIDQRGITVRWQVDGLRKDIILPAGQANETGGDNGKRTERQALTLSR